MELITQTNLQLYNQLRMQGYSDTQLAVVHRAYELLITIYPGYYQADGKPFVAHTVGVASILGH
jgi:(p)ppGpp synthase/HD superfamily hydrolase